jgi:hypothetical protein
MARAKVSSIDALRHFRVALIEYQDDIIDSVTLLELELRRALNWIELDRANYWPAQARRSSDKWIAARTDLQRCELAIRPDDRKPCMVERKALDRAKQRMRLCEEKVTVVKKWVVTLRQEGSMLSGRLARLRDVVERELPNAIATMQRLITALDGYAAIAESSVAGGEARSGAGAASDVEARDVEASDVEASDVEASGTEASEYSSSGDDEGSTGLAKTGGE